jgi:hypothetical protein
MNIWTAVELAEEAELEQAWQDAARLDDEAEDYDHLDVAEWYQGVQ